MILSLIMAIEDDADRALILSIYKHYYKAMYYKAYDILKDVGEAEDAVQDTVIRLIQGLDTLRTVPAEDRTAYVMTAVKFTAINRWNKIKRQNETRPLGFSQDAAETAAEEEGENAAAHLEDVDALCRCLRRLSERDRDLLLFRYALDLDIDEIAEKTGLAGGAVRTALMRARRRAYQAMQEEVRQND